MFSTAFAFIVVMIFLLFAVQLLFGLYARTTVTAIGADIAAEAASAVARGVDPHSFEPEVVDRLGTYGDDASVDIALVDADDDGAADTVAVSIDAELPTLLPARWIPSGAGRVTRTMRARIEQFDRPAPADEP